MITSALDFIKNILTDQYKDKMALKTDALQIYTILMSKPDAPALSFDIPFSSNKLLISVTHLNQAKEAYNAGRKVDAIKIIRGNGWLNQDMGDHPGLKEAKDFVEAFPS